jgi:mannan endo-1,4-beta-mannosidase
MTIPPPEPSATGHGRNASTHRAPARMLGVTQIVQTSELPAGVNALASADGKTIIVRAGLDKAARRRAVREVLAATHRFPALALYPALADARIRRFAAEVADAVSGLVQHAAGLVTPASPIGAIVASAAVVAAGAGVTVGVATGAIPVPSSPFAGQPSPATATAWPRHHRIVKRRLLPYPDSYLGVYEAGTPGSYEPITSFGQTVGHAPNLALYYSGWGEPFQATFARAARANHAFPVVQINPDKHASLAAIVDGHDDRYLLAFADAVNAYGRNVVIGFGHEMNADWYSWGWKSQNPALFVEAWQYIVRLFRSQGDLNVTWMWTINVNTPGKTGPMGDWWPGADYVTWVGIDGYYDTAADTFASVFGPTIADVHTVAAGMPILISETAAAPPESTEAPQITGLFRGIRRRQILGFIWYDAPGRSNLTWRLEGNTPATDAFRQAAEGYPSAAVGG